MTIDYDIKVNPVQQPYCLLACLGKLARIEKHRYRNRNLNKRMDGVDKRDFF